MLPYKSFFSWNVGPITIQSYGLLFAIGFSLAIYLIQKKFQKKKDKEHIYNLGILSVIFGIAGARLVYVLQSWQEFFPNNILGIFNVWEGGLAWIGGFVFAVIVSYLYIRKNKLDFWRYADKIAAPLALGHAFGRIGCILGDGGHVGKLTSMPWGFNVNGEIRHVTAWYSLINLLILFLLLTILEKKKLVKGSVFLLYIFYYSITRFIIDFFRIDQIYYGLTFTQWVCILLFITSGYLLYQKSKIKKAI